MNAKRTAMILVAALAVIFIVQNITDVEIRFLFWSASMSRALLVILLIAAGVVIGWGMSSSEQRRKKKENKE